MRDSTGRRLLKALALCVFYVDVGASRSLARLRHEPTYRLGGRCRRSARCCEQPGIALSRPFWHVPSLRRLFVWWQDRVNGFVLTGEIRSQRVLLFRCTHFDREGRACDSYASRPGICRDYPRALLAQPSPELLPGCGYRPVARDADRLLSALGRQELSDEQLRRLKRDLNLE
jgi:uncharacterized protein